MNKIISLAAVALLTVSSFSSADVYVSGSGSYFSGDTKFDEGAPSYIYFRVMPTYLSVRAYDYDNRSYFSCHEYSDSSNFENLKDFIYAVKNETTVSMSKQSNGKCEIRTYDHYTN